MSVATRTLPALVTADGSKAVKAGSAVMVAPSIVVLAGVGVADVAALLVGVVVELVELLPQPAATSITTATTSAAMAANPVRLPLFDALR
jgi:hypothetical protein